MAKPIELVPLLCVTCSTRLPAQPGEVAWVCPNCQQANLLDEKVGLEKLWLHYQTGIAANLIGKPFWVAEGKVQVNRETYSGNKSAEAVDFWLQPRQFMVPAYNLPLENLLEIGARLLRNPPKLVSGPAARFETVTLPRQDVRAVAEFIVIAIEADRQDKLKEINLVLELSEPVLWIVP